MVQRVALGALPGGGYGLLASRPGYNVLDPGLTPKQTAFDSRWPSAMRVFMQGSALLATVSTLKTTVYFGRTFSTPPLVIGAFTTNAGRLRLIRNSQAFMVTFTDRFEINPIPPGEASGTHFSYYVIAP